MLSLPCQRDIAVRLQPDLAVAILEFLGGLLIGLVLFWWQRSHSEAKLQKVLQALQCNASGFPTNTTSQISFVIAQQQRVHRDLEQQIKLYEIVLHNAPIGYLQVDDENRLVWCNCQARSLLSIGADPSPDRPRLLLELVRSYELDDLIEKTRNAGEPCQNDWTFHPVSADPSHLSEQPAYALRGYGLPLPKKHVGIFLENLQETLEMTQRCDRWASDLAHELKTPLTSIRLVAETLQNRLDPALKTWMDRLISETIRLSNLVQDLLDLSRLQRDALHSLRLKTTDLIELIAAVCDSLEPLARKKNLQFEYTGPDQLWLPLDEARFHRLLVNLLDNGIKYSPPDQKIKVKVSVQPDPNGENYTGHQQIRLEVIDFGSGFSEKDLPHVFDRFYRADPSRARQIDRSKLSGAASTHELFSSTSQPVPSQPIPMVKYDPTELAQQGGSGLGLAIVRQIAEAHQGYVIAGNHPKTRGAWLQVYLPWKAPEPPVE